MFANDLIFLMCSERSGSNLITKLFDAHPDICGPSTSHVGDVFIPNLYRYDFSSIKQWKKFTEDVSSLIAAKNAIWKKNFSALELQEKISQGNVADLFQYIYSSECNANKKSIAFIKENRIYEFFPFLLQNYPYAKYIYMVRDPRDMAASWKHSHAIRGGVVRATETWKKDQEGFLRMRSWNKKPIEIIKYEDLIKNPEATLKILCDKLNIKYSSSMLDYHLSSHVQDNAKAAIEWRNIAKPIMANNSNTFFERLTKDEIAFVETSCRDLMSAFSYEPCYEKQTALEYLQIKEHLSKDEMKDKANYAKVTEGEKARRKLHHSISQKVFNRDFKTPVNEH